MPTYKVEWLIDIDADTPQEAAEKAFATMQKPGTTANVFTVYEEAKEPVIIDLLNDEDDE